MPHNIIITIIIIICFIILYILHVPSARLHFLLGESTHGICPSSPPAAATLKWAVRICLPQKKQKKTCLFTAPAAWPRRRRRPRRRRCLLGGGTPLAACRALASALFFALVIQACITDGSEGILDSATV
mmetsp:Transcript_6562/g.10485  ORF Transcript_6562/g.10485 Transcript_6562/m.10485 type:complete len:129 (+) Transcript_6562:106-492(+)